LVRRPKTYPPSIPGLFLPTSLCRLKRSQGWSNCLLPNCVTLRVGGAGSLYSPKKVADRSARTHARPPRRCVLVFSPSSASKHSRVVPAVRAHVGKAHKCADPAHLSAIPIVFSKPRFAKTLVPPLRLRCRNRDEDSGPKKNNNIIIIFTVFSFPQAWPWRSTTDSNHSSTRWGTSLSAIRCSLSSPTRG